MASTRCKGRWRGWPAHERRAVAVRSHLRAATNDIHQALHAAAPFAAIAQGRARLAQYVATLRLLYRFHSATAPLCARGAVALGLPMLNQAHAARLTALREDLAHFGLAANNRGK